MSETIEERGIPPLRGGGGMSGKLRIMGVAFIILLFLVVFGAIALKKVREARAADKEEQVQQGEVSNENRDTDLKEPPSFVTTAASSRAGASDGAGAGAGGEDAAALSESGLQAPPAAAGGSAGGTREMTPAEQEEADIRERRQRAPVLAFSRTAPSLANNLGRDKEPAKEEDPYEKMMMAALSQVNPQQAASTSEGSPLSEKLKSDAYPSAAASHVVNRSFLVKQGTMGRCTMRTSFNSQLAGFSSCILSDPLYSADGRFVMAEAGSEVIGQYQTGQVKTGVSRAFVLWTSLETPHGVKIALDSPATDGMGQSGITGRVNNHFWKRYGSGLLLSMVDDGVSAATDRTERFRQTSESLNEAAAIAVQSNVDIPPTIKVRSGAVVNIFVARDLDFSHVYSARLVEPHGSSN